MWKADRRLMSHEENGSIQTTILHKKTVLGYYLCITDVKLIKKRRAFLNRKKNV